MGCTDKLWVGTQFEIIAFNGVNVIKFNFRKNWSLFWEVPEGLFFIQILHIVIFFYRNFVYDPYR